MPIDTLTCPRSVFTYCWHGELQTFAGRLCQLRMLSGFLKTPKCLEFLERWRASSSLHWAGALACRPPTDAMVSRDGGTPLLSLRGILWHMMGLGITWLNAAAWTKRSIISRLR